MDITRKMDEFCDYIEQVGEGLEQKQDEIIRRLKSLNRLMAEAISKNIFLKTEFLKVM